MSYQTAVTVTQVMMRGYPINSFLFWKVSKDNAREFTFYEFLRDYHQLDSRHNPTLIVLSLYPWADLRNNFHIDHIHPKTKFTKNKLKKKVSNAKGTTGSAIIPRTTCAGQIHEHG